MTHVVEPQKSPPFIQVAVPLVIDLSKVFFHSDFISWSFYTQTAGKIKIDLYESLNGKVNYFAKNVTNEGQGLEAIDKGAAWHKGTGLKMRLATSGNSIRFIETAHELNDGNKRVGATYSLVVEDWTDSDFNDVFVNINGWIKYA